MISPCFRDVSTPISPRTPLFPSGCHVGRLHAASVPAPRPRRAAVTIPSRAASLRGSSASTAESAVQQHQTAHWVQRFIELPPKKRGCHIITHHIVKAVPEIGEFAMGLAHIFVMHTSASLTLNENASYDVPLDMEDALNRIVPEGNHYRHLDEGLDDMPAHVKASLMGSSVTLPMAQGRLALGTWQGIWLNEHRDYGGPRRLVITLQGVKAAN